MYIAGAEHIKQADTAMLQQYAVPTLLLMETAGRKTAEHLLNKFTAVTHYYVLAGAGNNGGDGMVAARYLHAAGKTVWVMLVGDDKKLSPDAAINWAICQKAGIRCTVYAPGAEEAFAAGAAYPHALLLDALLGVGFSPPLRDPLPGILEKIRLLGVRVVAIDLPSGLEAHTGRVSATPIPALLTLTFAFPKICHYVTPAANFCGEVEVVDIGIYPELIKSLKLRDQIVTQTLVRQAFLPRAENAAAHDSHKGTYGHVLVAGGSLGKAGAIALCGEAALEVGAGLSTAFIPGSILQALQAAFPPVMCVPTGGEKEPHLLHANAADFETALAGKAAVALGPGLSNVPDTAAFMRAVLPMIASQQLPLVLDADALNILSDHDDLWKLLPAATVLTPHPGEMARLLHTTNTAIQQSRIESARKLATERSVVVVLKGAGTITALPTGACYINRTGNPGMATAGTGDVLTGAIAGLLAQGMAPAEAAFVGVYVHGRAGDLVARRIGQEGVTATRLLRTLSRALNLTA